MLKIGDKLTNDLIEFQMEIRKIYYFVKDGLEFTTKRKNEADEYYVEFESDIKLLEKNLKERTPIPLWLIQELDQIEIVARLYHFANTQKEIAYRMAHIFMFSIYESFLKQLFTKMFIHDKLLMENDEITSLQIIRMNCDELVKLINKKTKKISNVKKLENFLNECSLEIDLEGGFLEWSELKEGFYRRHVIVHKHGIYDEKYVQDTNRLRSLIGVEIQTDLLYIKNLANTICNFMGFLVSQILGQYSSPIRGLNPVKRARKIIEKIDLYRKISS